MLPRNDKNVKAKPILLASESGEILSMKSVITFLLNKGIIKNDNKQIHGKRCAWFMLPDLFTETTAITQAMDKLKALDDISAVRDMTRDENILYREVSAEYDELVREEIAKK